MNTRLLFLMACLGLATVVPATAQGVNRVVGPDGRVTFTDQPLPSGRPAGTSATPGAASAGGVQLPFELRQIASRYPVVLYTGKDCAPCNSGRNLLNARGIPYSEKTVQTPEDAEALRRIAGEAALPVLTIGGQRLRGFSDPEWTQYLNAAGYPAQSALPPGYRRPAPAPLVTVVPVPGTAAPTQAEPGAAPPAAPAAPAEIPVQPPATNPAGIRF